MEHSKEKANLVDLIKALKSEEDIAAFLECSLTESEIIMISERWNIFGKLKEGKTQRAISYETGAGIATVTRGAKAYRRGKAFIDKILEVK